MVDVQTPPLPPRPHFSSHCCKAAFSEGLCFRVVALHHPYLPLTFSLSLFQKQLRLTGFYSLIRAFLTLPPRKELARGLRSAETVHLTFAGSTGRVSFCANQAPAGLCVRHPWGSGLDPGCDVAPHSPKPWRQRRREGPGQPLLVTAALILRRNNYLNRGLG